MNPRYFYSSDISETALSRLRELIAAREVIWSLAWRDIKARYKQSVLGLGWAMFVPVVMMLIFAFVFRRVVPLETDIPYVPFAYCGLLFWNFFTSSTGAAVNSLVSNRGLLTKIYFPTEILPLSCMLASFADLLAGSIVLLGLMVFYLLNGSGTVLGATAFLVLPVLLVQIVFTTGISLLLAMGNLFFRDVRYVYNVLVVLWMFASPVIYAPKTSDATARLVLQLNPMTAILESYRDVLLRGKLPDWAGLGYAASVSVILLLVAWNLFYRLQSKFAEKI